MGTIGFACWAGLGPWDRDLTVNLGGAGAVLKVGQAGFGMREFDLGMSSSYTTTFENGIDLDNRNFILKNPFSTTPVYFTGVVTNSGVYKQSGNFSHYDGTTVFVGKPGRVDFYYQKNSQFRPYNGTIVFSNCTIRTHNDMIGGVSNISTPIHLAYGPGCDHRTDNAWDTFAGRAGSTLTVDGGTYDHDLILYLGSDSGSATDLGLEGNMVITNNGMVKLGTFAFHCGTVNQYSGFFAMPNDGRHGDGDPGRIGGWRAKSVPVVNGRGAFTYNLHGGVSTNDEYLLVAGSGTGTVQVANGGHLQVNGADGVRIALNAGSRGLVTASLGGTLVADQIRGGAGTSTFVFDGGVVRPRTTALLGDYVTTSMTAVAVSPLGGAIDTSLGDVTLRKPLGHPAESRSLAHRWSFADGSLVDAVGGLVATTVGPLEPALRVRGLRPHLDRGRIVADRLDSDVGEEPRHQACEPLLGEARLRELLERQRERGRGGHAARLGPAAEPPRQRFRPEHADEFVRVGRVQDGLEDEGLEDVQSVRGRATVSIPPSVAERGDVDHGVADGHEQTQLGVQFPETLLDPGGHAPLESPPEHMNPRDFFDCIYNRFELEAPHGELGVLGQQTDLSTGRR